jgi:hypothetical protein
MGTAGTVKGITQTTQTIRTVNQRRITWPIAGMPLPTQAINMANTIIPTPRLPIKGVHTVTHMATGIR